MYLDRLFKLMADKQASDLYITCGAPINIKVNGVVQPVSSQLMDVETVRRIEFRETPTLGVRRSTVQRTVLVREEATAQSPWGPVAGKVAFLPGGGRRFMPEYESCRDVAERNGVSLADVMSAAAGAWGRGVAEPPAR